MTIPNLEDRLLALTAEQFQAVKALRERCLDLFVKASRLRSTNGRKHRDAILAAIDKIEGDRLMAEASELDRQIAELLK